jgi:hypothetical protein
MESYEVKNSDRIIDDAVPVFACKEDRKRTEIEQIINEWQIKN